MEHDFKVYIHTNKINGKRYIGQTCQPLERRFANGKGYKRTPVLEMLSISMDGIISIMKLLQMD